MRSRKVHQFSAGAASSAVDGDDENTPPARQGRPPRKIRRLRGN